MEVKEIEQIESLFNGINFLHNISLKEYEVRNYVITHVIDGFIRQAFQTRIFNSMTHRQFNHFLSTLHRFAGNISRSSFSILRGLVNAIRDTSKEYKDLVNI